MMEEWMKNMYSKVVMGSLMSASLLAGVAVSSTANADKPLPPQDLMVTTIIDKSVIHGSLSHDANGNLVYDDAGNARFMYSGDIYSVETDKKTGELVALEKKIGDIKGEAAFPKEFVALSAGVNALMDAMLAGQAVTFPKMPPIVPWTCNHCYMTVGDSTYVSIVDALDPKTGNPDLIGNFDQSLTGGAAAAFDSMRMKGRAFTGITPASFDPATKTMSIRMAGCSALVAISGSQAGKIGTLCMNSTATFDVSGAIATFDTSGNQTGYEPTSAISADGSSNCVTVLHKPTL
jgi:hypothetical protein